MSKISIQPYITVDAPWWWWYAEKDALLHFGLYRAFHVEHDAVEIEGDRTKSLGPMQ